MGVIEREDKKRDEIVEWIRNDWDQAEVYAYGNGFLKAGKAGWHYKSVWFTPLGCVKFDTGYTTYLTSAEADTLIKNYRTAEFPLVRVTPEEVIESWAVHFSEVQSDDPRQRIVETYFAEGA